MATLQEFIANAESNEALRSELMKVNRSGDWATEATSIARNHGYEFTPEELKAAIQARYEGDLNEEALDRVAGGTCNSGKGW